MKKLGADDSSYPASGNATPSSLKLEGRGEVMKCNACGKEMRDKELNREDFGIFIALNATKGMEVPHLQKQLGIYKLGKKYAFCFECWLKSLGAKP